MSHIAVDIGASSGRLVAGELEQGKLTIEEIHRFSNGFTDKDGTAYWDIDHLFHEILVGLEKAKAQGCDQCTVGIDTWAVDYVLLDKNGERLQEVVSYRDDRTEQTMAKVFQHIPKQEIYEITGIQFLTFNTLYQLYEEDKNLLQQTDKILMVPDYLNYRLTGNMHMETTNASTTQLLDVKERHFSERLLDLISLTKDHFAPFVEPGHVLGPLKKELYESFDLPECQIINVASHDTASAVVGTPGQGEHWAYISSGTWSLLGIETDQPVINQQALEANYTNEWGAFKTYRFLKNIMGMWIIQEVRRLLDNKYDYGELVVEAKKVEPFQQFIDFNEDRFLNPDHMIREIQNYCEETKQPIPTTPGELASAVYNNLAIIYAIELEELEAITKETIDHLYIVGGGGQNDLLNQLTADLSNKPVYIGPSEATAIGNIVMQMITSGKIADLQEARMFIADSFGLTEFVPQEIDRKAIIQRFKEITKR